MLLLVPLKNGKPALSDGDDDDDDDDDNIPLAGLNIVKNATSVMKNEDDDKEEKQVSDLVSKNILRNLRKRPYQSPVSTYVTIWVIMNKSVIMVAWHSSFNT